MSFMDLIDRTKYRKDLLHAYDDVSMEFDVLDSQPSVNVIPIPEGATNGDMIMTMFPNAKTWEVTRDDIHCAYIEFEDICEIKSFPLSWWNAPYKE